MGTFVQISASKTSVELGTNGMTEVTDFPIIEMGLLNIAIACSTYVYIENKITFFLNFLHEINKGEVPEHSPCNQFYL